MRPKTVFVTHEEGGPWFAFPSKYYPGERLRATGVLVHSIRFDDGSVWDAVNGWRTVPAEPPQRSRPTSAKVGWLIVMCCVLADVVIDAVSWYQGEPASGTVWLFSAMFSALMATYCFDRVVES